MTTPPPPPPPFSCSLPGLDGDREPSEEFTPYESTPEPTPAPTTPVIDVPETPAPSYAPEPTPAPTTPEVVVPETPEFEEYDTPSPVSTTPVPVLSAEPLDNDDDSVVEPPTCQDPAEAYGQVRLRDSGSEFRLPPVSRCFCKQSLKSYQYLAAEFHFSMAMPATKTRASESVDAKSDHGNIRNADDALVRRKRLRRFCLDGCDGWYLYFHAQNADK